MSTHDAATVARFENFWPDDRRERAWSEEVGRRSAQHLAWLIPAGIGAALILLGLDVALEAPPLLPVSRLIVLGGLPLSWILWRRKQPLAAMRASLLSMIGGTLALIAFVVSDGRLAEPYLAFGLVLLVISPVGLRWTIAAAAVLGLGSMAVALPDAWVGHYINAAVFPLVAVLTRRFIDGLGRDAFEARLRVEWARERERKLLFDLLPHPVADELLARGEMAPRVAEATVVFLDLVGFSQAARTVPPVRLLETLERLFSAFDAVVARRRLVKIKTLGDGYLLAGGLFESHPQLEETLNAARELLGACEAHSGALGAGLRVRVGVHVGPVVAGVIGKNRPSFDIWGDTVNVAARVEQLGEPGAVVVSEEVVRKLPPGFAVDDIGVRTGKHGLQLHLYRLRS